MRDQLLNIFVDALHSVAGKNAVHKALESDYPQLSTLASIRIIAIGKAAESMLKGAFSALPNASIEKALLITKRGHVEALNWENPHTTIIEASHPVPDQSSLDAGQALIQFVEESDSPLLFLISGGASSLVEHLQAGWDFENFQAMTQWMLANAYSIEQINHVRQSVSTIKAGGLWRSIKAEHVHCLLISDVPSDNVGIIGSGLLFPPSAPLHIPASLPNKWRNKLINVEAAIPATDFHHKIIASNRIARKTAQQSAENLGFNVIMHDTILEGDVLETAAMCVETILKTPNTLFIWGAETTVILPDNPGRGGRNQHFALAAALLMQHTEGCYLLSAGTDGTDGMTEDTGALVDSNTMTRGKLAGLEAKQYLNTADAGTFLAATGDLISTGVTGTNVMDLIFAMRIEH